MLQSGVLEHAMSKRQSLMSSLHWFSFQILISLWRNMRSVNIYHWTQHIVRCSQAAQSCGSETRIWTILVTCCSLQCENEVLIIVSGPTVFHNKSFPVISHHPTRFLQALNRSQRNSYPWIRELCVSVVHRCKM